LKPFLVAAFERHTAAIFNPLVLKMFDKKQHDSPRAPQAAGVISIVMVIG